MRQPRRRLPVRQITYVTRVPTKTNACVGRAITKVRIALRPIRLEESRLAWRHPPRVQSHSSRCGPGARHCAPGIPTSRQRCITPGRCQAPSCYFAERTKYYRRTQVILLLADRKERGFRSRRPMHRHYNVWSLFSLWTRLAMDGMHRLQL